MSEGIRVGSMPQLPYREPPSGVKSSLRVFSMLFAVPDHANASADLHRLQHYRLVLHENRLP